MADLNRFIQAQAQYYNQALDELRTGHKRSHWMWFIFPQLKGLGHSHAATYYGINNRKKPKLFCVIQFWASVIWNSAKF